MRVAQPARPAPVVRLHRRAAAGAAPAGSVTVVGLGPGAPGLLTRETEEVLAAASTVYCRTLEHPTLAALPALPLRSFDAAYEQAGVLQEVYPRIAAQLVAAAQAGEAVVYAVPGDACVAEQSVLLLRAACAEAGVPLRVCAAVSFLEPLLSAVGRDVLPSLLVADALDVAAAGFPPFSVAAPALLTQLHSPAVASDVKLTLMAALPDDHRVALVTDAGGAAQSVQWVPLHELDRCPGISSRTALFIPPAPGASFEAVLGGLARARDQLAGAWAADEPSHVDAAAALGEAAAAAAAAAAQGDAEALRAALAQAVAAIALHAVVAVDEGEWSAPQLLAEAAALTAGAASVPGARPVAPLGRGYALEEEAEEEEE